MPFTFVDHNAPFDSTTKRRIRTQAAVGKNVGRKLNRPSKASTYARAKRVQMKMPESAELIPRDHPDELPLQRQLGGVFVMVSFPADIASFSKLLIYRAIDFIGAHNSMPELAGALQGPKTSQHWARLMLEDEGIFHGSLALAIVGLNHLAVYQEDPAQAVRCLLLTLRIVNQRLSKPTGASDLVLAVVVLLIQYETILGNRIQGAIHLEGLRRMVEFRGGLPKVRPIMRCMLRCDLSHALVTGATTIWSLKDLEDVSPASDLIAWEQDAAGAIPKAMALLGPVGSAQLLPQLADCLNDLTYLARLLNEAAAMTRPPVNHTSMHTVINITGYRLVNVHSSSALAPLGKVNTALRVAMIAVLVPYLRGPDARMQEIPYLSDSLRNVLLDERLEDQVSREAMLWLLFLGATWRLRDSYEPEMWLIARLARVIRELGLNSWEEARCILSEYPWIHVLYDYPARGLWHKTMAWSHVLQDTSSGMSTPL